MNKGDCNLEYGFYDGIADPCIYNASDFNGLITGLTGKDTGYGYGFGVVGNIMNMQVEIDPGFAIIGGIWISLKSKLIISGYSSTFTCVWFDIDKANKTADLKSSTNSSNVPSEITTGDHLIIYLWRTSTGSTTDYRGSANFPKLTAESSITFFATISGSVVTLSGTTTLLDVYNACLGGSTVYVKINPTQTAGYKSMGHLFIADCILVSYSVKYVTLSEVKAEYTTASPPVVSYKMYHAFEVASSSGRAFNNLVTKTLTVT